MAKIKQLERYTTASLAVVEFKRKHAKIFAEFDALLLDAGEAEAQLKDYVKSDVKGNIANSYVRVTYSPAFKKTYDVETILKHVTGKQKVALIDMGALAEQWTVDNDKVEEAVEKGVIPVEVKQAAFKETELAPRVSIKENK
jgi:hypothetical protein